MWNIPDPVCTGAAAFNVNLWIVILTYFRSVLGKWTHTHTHRRKCYLICDIRTNVGARKTNKTHKSRWFSSLFLDRFFSLSYFLFVFCVCPKTWKNIVDRRLLSFSSYESRHNMDAQYQNQWPISNQIASCVCVCVRFAYTRCRSMQTTGRHDKPSRQNERIPFEMHFNI